MNELWCKLTSRKFLLALGSAITAMANGEWQVAMGIVIAYITMEAGIDAFKKG